MEVELQVYASLRERYPEYARGALVDALSEAVTVQQFLAQCGVEADLVHLVLLNGMHLTPEALSQTRLQSGDRVGIWPPIAGG